MKKLFAALLSVTMAVTALSGCTADQVGETTGGTTGTEQVQNGIELSILGQSSSQDDMNLVRDMLTKAGFVVELNMQPDYASFKTQLDSGNYDLAVSGWTTVTGNPDYAVRSLYKTGGDYNVTQVSDPEIDALIDQAGTETPAEYVKTYSDLETKLVTENAYIIPLYQSVKSQGINSSKLKLESVRLSKSRSMVWEEIDFVDESLRDTEPMVTSQASSTITSLDPVRGNDGSMNMLSSNTYVKIVNLTDDDQVITDGTLSYSYAIGEGNSDFYFVLRDDINFAKVEDMAAVDTGVRVGAEDVVFSLTRALNKDSVPDHRTYTLHESMKEITIVTDPAELDTVLDSDTGKPIREILEAKTPSAIAELTDDKTAVNNAEGTYQVVKVTTNVAFPQVLNYLAHQSAGIVSEEQVTAINTFEVAAYDRTTDIAYGDQVAFTEGETYDNHIWASGPYIPLYKNDYQIYFEKNPAYMPGTEYAPRIKNLDMKFIADADASLSAFRSGETYVLYSVPTDKWPLVEEDPNLSLVKIPSNTATYMWCNINREPLSDVNVRLAILNAISQEDIIAFYDNYYFKAYSTVSPLVQTGNELVADPAKVAEYLTKYWESQQ